MNMIWNYYTVSNDGKALLTEDGYVDITSEVPMTAEQWEQYLIDNDLRGTVR